MGDGGVCPAQATAMTTLNLSAAQMESSTRTIAIGENAPAEQVTQTLFANFPSSFFHFNFPAEKILRQISSNHVRLVTGNTDIISPSFEFNFPAKNDCNRRKTQKLIRKLEVYVSLSLFLLSF